MAGQAGESVPNLGTGVEALGTRPVSPLCPCKPKERLEQPLGTARPAMPLCIHRECLPGDRLGDSQGSDRAALGHGWDFSYPNSRPQSVPAAPGGAGGDVGLCQRSCPALPRVGEAELRQEC